MPSPALSAQSPVPGTQGNAVDEEAFVLQFPSDATIAGPKNVLDALKVILDANGVEVAVTSAHGVPTLLLDESNARTGATEVNARAMQAARERGERGLLEWTTDGTLILGKELEEEWHLSRQALDAARERGEVFSLRVKGRHYYPAAFRSFTREQLAAINRALGTNSAASRLIFFMREHGALRGRKPAKAIGDQFDDILRLASAWGFND